MSSPRHDVRRGMGPDRTPITPRGRAVAFCVGTGRAWARDVRAPGGLLYGNDAKITSCHQCGGTAAAGLGYDPRKNSHNLFSCPRRSAQRPETLRSPEVACVCEDGSGESFCTALTPRRFPIRENTAVSRFRQWHRGYFRARMAGAVQPVGPMAVCHCRAPGSRWITGLGLGALSWFDETQRNQGSQGEKGLPIS